MDEYEKTLFNEFSHGLKSKRGYLNLLEDFKEFIGVDLIGATPTLVEQYLDSLVNNNNNTKRRKYHQLLSFYNFLLDDLVIQINPVSLVKAPEASKDVKIERTLDFKNIPLLLNHLRDKHSYRDYVITLIIATTGLKVSEVRTLKWSDFFIDNNNKIGVSVGSKDYGRYVRIFDFVWKAINQHRKILSVAPSYMKEDYYVFFAENKLSDYKTYPKIVKPISSDWLKKVYTKACEELNIPLVTSKDIRHSYTMLCIKLGSPAEDIKDQLGWSSTNFLFRYDGVIDILDSPINNIVEDYYEDVLDIEKIHESE